MVCLFEVGSLAERAMLSSATKERTVSMSFMLIDKSRGNKEGLAITRCRKSGTVEREYLKRKWIWNDNLFKKNKGKTDVQSEIEKKSGEKQVSFR